MSPKLLAWLCVLLAFNTLFAEDAGIEELPVTDSMESQILNFEEVKSPLIFKGRLLLLAKFGEGDLKAVREIMDYLLGLEDVVYEPFKADELHLLWLWTEEYAPLLHALSQYGKDKYDLRNEYMEYTHNVASKLLIATKKSKEHLQKQIQKSALNIEEQTFLLLFLDWLVSPNSPYLYPQQVFNERVNKFLKEFPQSKFETFVRSHIRHKKVLETWGWGVEVFSSYGILTGNLHKEYTNVAPSFGADFDLYHNNLVSYLRFFIGDNKTKKDKPYDLGIWEKGSKNDVAFLEMSLGYTLYDGNSFKITPFAGIGSQAIDPKPVKGLELEDFNLGLTTAYVLGANLDIKIQEKNIDQSKYDPVGTFLFCRIRYGYSVPQFASKYPGMSGNMHYINLGLGLALRDTKREY